MQIKKCIWKKFIYKIIISFYIGAWTTFVSFINEHIGALIILSDSIHYSYVTDLSRSAVCN